MRRFAISPRVRAGAAALATAALTVACGGGGGGEDTISVVLGYGQAAPAKSAEYTPYDSGSPVGGGAIPGAHFAVASGQLAPGTWGRGRS